MGVNIAKLGSAQLIDTQLLMGACAGLLYMASSIAMVFVNKATMMTFPNANCLLLMQMLAAIAIIRVLLMTKVVAFPSFSRHKAKLLLPVTLLYTANVGFSLTAVAALNVPMYNALKRLTPVFILLAKAIMTGSLPPWQISGSVLLIVFGCIIAGIGDLTFHLPSYLYAIASCLLQTTYLLLVERTGVEKDATSTELLYYNSVLSLPFITVLLFLTGEAWQALPDYRAGALAFGDTAVTGMLLGCSLSGIVLNFALFWSTQLNSALTTTIIGVFKGVVTTVLGFFILGGVQFHSFWDVHVLGIVINTVGGIWYTGAKYNQRRERLMGAKHSAEADTIPQQGHPEGASTTILHEQTSLLRHAGWRKV